MDEAFRIIRSGSLSALQQYIYEHHDMKINSTRWSGFSLLHRAAGVGSIDMCEVLLDNGADINLRSVRGWYTPLHIALANGYTDVAMFLIERGAHPWQRSKTGEDPYDYGIKRGFRRSVEEFRGKIVKMDMANNLKRHKELLARQKTPKTGGIEGHELQGVDLDNKDLNVNPSITS